MSLFFVVGIYFYARGVFAVFGQTFFYTKRILDLIEPENLPAYLRASGTWHLVAGTIFVGKALTDIMYPGNKMILAIFFVLLVVCVFFLARCNERYVKK
ncbi:hypothetical protein [Anaerotignum sp. MB30-C6]|uniref:hypothetical protein n=1 Tax=Anaerotignum sp. MB30-C6 TaxID=3070814 RepID=UPI0027DC3132|nr:hypothetical protein [Anaerotignum sp. MB30-C6]WMI80517.1 hypothetical protein RBQ60_11860 [Anaerotignum sp. MB30-C6]